MPLLLSPGQGAQSAGMLAPWLDLPAARETVARWSSLTGLDLLTLGAEAPADVVRSTDVAQPLLTALALLSGRAVLAGALPQMTCGHSVGELSALALAGVVTDDEAVLLAARRGQLMADAAAVRPTGMAAVLGGDVDEALLAAAGLELATVNAPGQVVVGGPSTRSTPGRRRRAHACAGSTWPVRSTPPRWRRRCRASPRSSTT